MDRFRQDDDSLQRLKRLNYDGMWNWVFDSIQRAMDRRDQQRQMMVRLLTNGGAGIEGDFDRGLEQLNRGRALAQRLDEHWWTVLFDHWRLQILLKKGDYPLARELVMHLVTEVRKPRYEGLPLRVCVQEDLIRICTETDPAGYAPRIEQAVRYMERTITPGTHCHHCLHSLRSDFAREMHRWDDAERCLQDLLNLDKDEPRALAVHHTNMCRVAYERGDLAAVREWARSAEALARKANRIDCLAECLAWQALGAHAADPVEGERLAREAISAAQRIVGPPHPDYYDTICLYYEAAGAPDQALDTRFTQLKHLAGKGRLARELGCRASICRLLLTLGRPAKNQIAAARKVAQELTDPAPTLALLDRIDREGPTSRGSTI